MGSMLITIYIAAPWIRHGGYNMLYISWNFRERNVIHLQKFIPMFFTIWLWLLQFAMVFFDGPFIEFFMGHTELHSMGGSFHG